MSQKHPINRDRVSPRRRFHRPAAEFLGARRQVPVLTGLPRIDGEDEPAEASISSALPEPDIVDRVLETVTEEPTVNIREATPHVDEVVDPWREWAYPIGGILIASLLCYTAWVGLNNPITSTNQANREANRQSTRQSTDHLEIDRASALHAVDTTPSPTFEPVRVAEAMPSSGTSTRSPDTQPSLLDPVVQPPLTDVPATPKTLSHVPTRRPAPVFVPEAFLQQPIQEPESSPQSSSDFVQREVLDWNEVPTSAPPTGKTTNEQESQPPKDGPAVGAKQDVKINLEEPNLQAVNVENTVSETGEFSPALAAAPEDELTSDLDYPSTGYANDFQVPPIGVNSAGGIDLAEISPPTSVATADLASIDAPLAPPVENAAATPVNSPMLPQERPSTRPFELAGTPFTNTPQTSHVVVNPHFQPNRIPTNAYRENAAFKTAALPTPTQHPTSAAPQLTPVQETPGTTSAPIASKSIYGSFPIAGIANSETSTTTAVEQARLNGSIEPFPRSN